LEGIELAEEEIVGRSWVLGEAKGGRAVDGKSSADGVRAVVGQAIADEGSREL
jgi:hypothetical protein